MTVSVSLPMYDQAPQAAAAFWAGLRRHLDAAGLADPPAALIWPADLDAHWRSPDLLLSQTCGYPLATVLSGKVQLVGTPRYRAPGCVGSDYASVLVVRSGDPAASVADLRDRRAAVNSRHSQSGHNSLRACVAPHARGGRFFSAVVETGAHAASLQAIQRGDADVAAIDCVSFALFARHHPPAVAGLRVIGTTDTAPGLPLITALATPAQDVERLRAGFMAACADPALATARDALLLDGFEVRPLRDYERCLAMESSAQAQGYPHLA